MQLVDVRNAHLIWGCTSARKGRRHVLYRRTFPCANLRRVNAMFLGQIRQRHLLADCFKRNLGLEIGRMVLSFRHLGSLLSQVDPS